MTVEMATNILGIVAATLTILALAAQFIATRWGKSARLHWREQSSTRLVSEGKSIYVFQVSLVNASAKPAAVSIITNFGPTDIGTEPSIKYSTEKHRDDFWEISLTAQPKSEIQIWLLAYDLFLSRILRVESNTHTPVKSFKPLDYERIADPLKAVKPAFYLIGGAIVPWLVALALLRLVK